MTVRASRGRIGAALAAASFACIPMLAWPATATDGPPEIPLTSTGIAGLTLLASTFSDAAALFGPAQVGGAADNPMAIRSACYVSARAGDKTELMLRSDPVGKGQYLTVYILMQARRNRAGTCAASKAVHAGLPALDGRLRLGMSKQQVKEAMGAPYIRNLDGWSQDNLPGNRRPNTWVYMVTWHAPFSDVDQHAIAGLLDRSGSAHAYAWTRAVLNFHDSRLTRIEVSHGVGY